MQIIQHFSVSRFIKSYYNKNNMDPAQQRKLVLIKFEQDQVLFQHKETRRIYRYFNLHQTEGEVQQVQSDSIQRAIFFGKGVLYQKQQSNLEIEVSQRSRSSKKQYYTQQEIINTFLPLFECLKDMRQKGIAHGAIALESIIIFEGEVKLRDRFGEYLLEKKQKTVEKDNDVESLGQSLIACTFLQKVNVPQAEIQKELAQRIGQFTKKFSIVLLILIRKISKFYENICQYLNEETKDFPEQLSLTYQQITTKKKKPLLQPLQEQLKIISLSPMIKTPVTHKKTGNYENIENKMEGTENKKTEKSKAQKNSNAHQLMIKRLNEEQKRVKEQTVKKIKEKVPISNLSYFGVQNNSKKIIYKDNNSPFQRIRALSKKK